MQNETFSILIFHGSARSEANSAARTFAGQLESGSGCRNFSVCFLKGAVPELEDEITRVATTGWRNIRLIPLFLLPGTHTGFDIPTAAKNARAKFPEVKIEILACLVNWPEFLDLVAKQIKAHTA
ncbi:MAG: CbiX/SirB N-terminal domain-containing protein [Candidatus Riflebacteria bacterium]|jgi:sirohydrochlorin ferrochelatase|nr:CbiX/SirB N-terminal domain-containing protein [Candidatus Riflebacteria bacterium]